MNPTVRLGEMGTERLVLRAQHDGDAVVFRQLWTERDPRVPVHRRIDADGSPSLEDIAAQIREAGEPGLLSIVLRGTERVIGYCGVVFHGNGDLGEPEIAFELLQDSHNRNYATEAATAVLAQVAELGYQRVWATVWDWNAPSLRVLEKLGFVDSGRADPATAQGRTILLVARL